MKYSVQRRNLKLGQRQWSIQRELIFSTVTLLVQIKLQHPINQKILVEKCKNYLVGEANTLFQSSAELISSCKKEFFRKVTLAKMQKEILNVEKNAWYIVALLLGDIVPDEIFDLPTLKSLSFHVILQLPTKEFKPSSVIEDVLIRILLWWLYPPKRGNIFWKNFVQKFCASIK